MQERMKIADDVTVSAQPDTDTIAQLPGEGFQSVVNFRTDGEDDQPLSPAAEREAVEAAGMQYVHIPVSMQSMGTKLVDQFRERYAELPKPVFAHCKSGKRAGAMVMMHLASEQGLNGEQALEQAKQKGFECDQPELETFVRHYVDARSVSR